MFRALALSILTLLFAASALAANPSLKLRVSEPVMAGETASLDFIVIDGDMPEVEKLPKVEGIRWGRGFTKSTSTTIVNFKRSSIAESSINFVVDKEGDYTIPPVKVQIGKLKTQTDALSFHAGSRKFDPAPAPAQADDNPPPPPSRNAGRSQESPPPQQVRLEDAIFLRLHTPEKRSFYVGEEIPVSVNFYHLANVEAAPAWPELEFGETANAVLRDYSAVNPKNPKFDGYKLGTQKIDGRNYEVYRFGTAVRVLSPGKLALKAACRAEIVLPDRGDSRRSLFDIDSPFGNPFRRAMNRDLAAAAPSIEILPLPPPPTGTLFLGLVGDWKPAFSLSSEHARVGEPLTLILKLNGSGSIETLKPPQFEIPGFRVYPPEVENPGGKPEIRYVLIPTDEGEAEIRLEAATFDSLSGQYKTVSFSKRLKVGKGQALNSSGSQPGQVVVAAKAGADSTRIEAEAPRKSPTGVLYLKKGIERGIELPLWRNAVLPSAIILIAGLGAMGALLLVHFRRAKLSADPKYARRAAAAARRKEVLRFLKEAPAEKLSDAASEKLLPCLADLLDAPPGSGAGELAELLRKSDPELAECLDKIAGSAWAPGVKPAFDDAFKKRLLGALAKISLALLLCLAPLGSSFGANAASALLKAAPSTLDDAMTAYDSGDFAGAASFFKSKLDPARPSPAALYDLGNCLYQLGELPKALLCYERALRLAPRDSDILENLNLVRRKLDLPERYRLDSPADAIPCFRDFLRPDEWACLIFLGIAVVLVSLGLRTLRGSGSSSWLWLLAAGIALSALSTACVSFQLCSSYSPDDAIVMIRSASVRNLPSDSAPAADIKLRLGEQVKVLERRGDWLRIRSSGDSAEGWLKASAAAFLWRSSPVAD